MRLTAVQRQQSIDNTIDQIMEMLRNYGTTVDSRFSQQQEQQQTMLTNLDNDDVRRVIQDSEEAVEISEQLAANLNAAQTQSTANQAGVATAISALLLDLEQLSSN